MKFRNPFQSATDRLISKEVEHLLYQKVGIDFENNNINNGIWTKALGKAEGDEIKQKGIYIELMVEHYRDEIRAGEELAKILATEANKEKERQRQEEILRKEKQEEEEERKKRHEQREKREKITSIIVLTGLVIFFVFILAADF